MNGNIALLLFSFLFIFLLTLYYLKKWPDLDVVDLYIIFIGLHFGIMPFIRGWHFDKDVIFDFREVSPLALGLVFLHMLIIVIVIRVSSLYFGSNLMKYLKIRHLISSWYQTNKYILFLLGAWLIIFNFISYYKFNIITYISPDDFARFNEQLPYWFTSTRTVYNCLSFCVFIGLFAYIVNSKNIKQYLLIGLAVIFIPIVTIYGRRYFVEMIVVSVIFWFVYKEENIFRLKYVTVALGLIVAFFIFSNLFQAYRSVFQTVGKIEINKLENVFSAALNYKSTLKNFTNRPGTWEFNFLVIEKQLNKTEMTAKGRVSLEGLKSSIPRLFWPEKQFTVIDNILSKLYDVDPRKIDIGKNIAGVFQVDFGYYSIIIMPLIVLAIIYIFAILVKIATPYPTFLWLISGNIIFYLVNIEENGNEIFFMVRNIIIIMILLGSYMLSSKIYLTLFKNGTTARHAH
jgi:hypothetical protein